MRVIEVCRSCREKKVKCDRQLPTCASCRRSHVRCVYAPWPRKTSPPAQPNGRQLLGEIKETSEPSQSQLGDGDVPVALDEASRNPDLRQLKFITFDNPDTARNAVNRNIVRSHVMSNIRRQQKKKKLEVGSSVQLPGQILSDGSTVGNLQTLKDLQLAPIHQPSQANIVQQYLVSNFISLNPRGTSTIGSFFSHLPHFMSDTTFRPLKQATAAVVTNHYGTVVHDRSIQLQSRVPYIAAVNGLLKVFLQAGSTRNVQTELGISISILLMVYELRTGETNDGWINHGRGAERLFLALHPDVYRRGPSHDAVRFLRYVVSVLACTQRTPTALAREPWKSDIFAITPKHRDDVLIDSLVLVPTYLYEMDNMRTRSAPHTIADIERLYQDALSLKEDLDNWLATYLRKDHEELSRYLPFKSADSHRTIYYLWMHQDTITNDELYHFTTGMILTLSILQDTCPPSGVPSLYSDQIRYHSSFIISIIPEINRRWGPENGPITLVLPLKMVAALSPDPEQRHCARNKLAKWDRGIGTGGYLLIPHIKFGNLYTMNRYSSSFQESALENTTSSTAIFRPRRRSNAQNF